MTEELVTEYPHGVVLHSREPFTPYRRVLRDGHLIGWVWDGADDAQFGLDPARWYALPDPARQRHHGVRTFTGQHQAVRWLALLARPVVYRVKVHPRDAEGHRATVFWDPLPEHTTAMAELGVKGVGFSLHGYAIFTATNWARDDVERKGVSA